MVGNLLAYEMTRGEWRTRRGRGRSVGAGAKVENVNKANV